MKERHFDSQLKVSYSRHEGDDTRQFDTVRNQVGGKRDVFESLNIGSAKIDLSILPESHNQLKEETYEIVEDIIRQNLASNEFRRNVQNLSAKCLYSAKNLLEELEIDCRIYKEFHDLIAVQALDREFWLPAKYVKGFVSNEKSQVDHNSHDLITQSTSLAESQQLMEDRVKKQAKLHHSKRLSLMKCMMR